MKKIKDKYFTLISWCLLVFTFLFLCYFIYTRINCLLNSDMSSEMILSNLIAHESGFISTNWFYSTELRVFNTQLFFGFFFHFFDDWHLVRVLGSISLYILLLIACYLFCKEIKQKRYFPMIATFFLLPFSTVYFYTVIYGVYYIPHIVFGFIIFALIMHIINSLKKPYLFYIILFIVSLMAGLNGLRQVVTLFLPLFVSSLLILYITYFYKAKFKSLIKYLKQLFIKKISSIEFKYFIACTISLIGALIGYFINSHILSKIYTYATWDNISFKNFDITRFIDVFFGFIGILGYSESEINLFSVISNFLAFVLFILTLLSVRFALKNKNKISKEYYILSIFVSCAFIIFILIYSFTNLQYIQRYNIPIIVFFIPLIIFYFKYNDWHLICKKTALCILTILLLISAGYNYKHYYFSNDKTIEYKKIVKVLLKNKSYNGYSGFWASNVLTELSNGKIDVWDWADCDYNTNNLSNVYGVDIVYEWLQKKDHVSTRPSGKVFVLFAKNRTDNNKYFDNFNKKDYVAYSSDYFILYIFDDYNTLVDYINMDN